MLLLAAGVAATLGPRCFRVLMSANSAWGRRLGDPAVVSLVAIGLLWAALFANNLALISPLLGFDRDGHLQYVDYILQNRSLPLADQGWQMYQPPLFYTLSAIIVSPFGSTASPGAVVTLRAFSAAIGLAHVGLIFCCLRLLFPANKTRQVVGLWFASMLPAHLALSHHITNEVLSAVLVTGCLLFCLRVFRAAHPRPFALIGAGFCLGLALLTKFSAVVAVPVVAAALGWHAFAQQGGPRQAVFRALRASAIVFGVALVVCAWHYVRVWHRFGNPLIGNWDPQLPFAWWQDPGFRTSAWLWNLGPGVASPLFSGMFGFWDGIYSTLWADGMCSGSARLPFRPAWDYGLMVAGCAIAVPMTVLLAAGAVAAIRRLFVRPGPDLILMGGLLAGLGFALLYMSLRVASFAQVKAFYALPALLPLCLGAALGYDLTQRRWPALRIALRMLTIFWVLTILCSFWIRLGNPFTWSVLGIGQADENDYRAAIASFDRALALDPKDAATTAIRADALARSGQLSEAVAAADAAVNLDPASAQAELELGIVLSLASRYAEAISHMTRALELASDLPTGPQVLATALSRLERWEEVESICRQGLVLDPLNRNLHYSLAKAMASTGNWTDAETHGRYAVGIDPGWDEAHGLMGSIFAARGQTKQAVSEFAAAVRVKPDNPQLHSLLAAAYLAAAEPEKAAEQYRETLRLEPENPETLNNLAWLLATTRADKVRSGVEAVRLAQRACELTGQREPALIGTLAAAYAETGRFGEAVQAAEKARALALDTGRPELASRNDELLRLYRAGKAAREGAQ
jgi:Flp pilus assembly protein TadD